SLDEVIKNLENDQQRAKLLADLKKLRDATKQSQPTVEQGVLGLIGGALHDLEKQFSGDASPFRRWSLEIDQAQQELAALIVPVHQWPAI
ncbi:mechanosensitive ion channel family protein, partial [Pseudomonas otitidis]